MTIVRLSEFSAIEKILLKNLYVKVKKTPKDGQWRTFKGVLKFREKQFFLECDFLMKDLFMEVGELKINKPLNASLIIQ